MLMEGQKFTGVNDEALHEIHIFLADLNPTSEKLAQYNQAVEDWNHVNVGLSTSSRSLGYPMKACFLALVFRAPDGTENVVKVMQSARYVF